MAKTKRKNPLPKAQPSKAEPHTIEHAPQTHREAPPLVNHNANVPARLIEENRQNSNSIITSLNKTAVALASKDGGVQQVEIMERLYAMQRVAEDRQAEREFGVAKVALAMGLPTIPKRGKIEFIDKTNQKQEREYATRVDIESVLGPLCRMHGFSLEYSTETDSKGWACQVLTVRHVGGHKEVYRSPSMPLDTSGAKNNQQGAGSTSEYGKRYAVIGAFNIIGVDRDDDGNLGKHDGGDAVDDKFTSRVLSAAAKAAEKKPETPPQPRTMTLEEAAVALAKKLADAPVDKRGDVLMGNLKIIAAMEAEPALAAKAAEMRAFCVVKKEETNDQSN